MIRFLIPLLSLFTGVATPASSPVRHTLVYAAESARSVAEFRGLPGVSLARWTEGLFSGEPSSPRPGTISAKIDAAIGSSLAAGGYPGCVRTLGAALAPLARRYPDSRAYVELARELVRGRARVAAQTDLDCAKRQAYLLGVLSDEALYVSGARFGAPAELRVGDPGDIRPGDVVTTKSAEFSSLMLQLRSPEAAPFSHAQLAFRERPGRGVELIEAEPFGLNRAVASGEHGPRMAIFRPRAHPASDDPSGRLTRATLELIEEGTRRGGGVLRRGLPFDFSFRARCGDARAYCSELVYCIHRAAGVAESRNPYASRLWLAPRENPVPFIRETLDLDWTPIPAPGDVEFSPNYSLAAYRVDVAQLPALRLHLALGEALVRELHENPDLFSGYARSLHWLGAGRRAQDLRAPASLPSLARLTGVNTAVLAQVLGALPPEMPAESILFYYHFDHELMPAASRAVADAIANDPRHRGYLTLEELGDAARVSLRSKIREFNRRAPWMALGDRLRAWLGR